MKANPTDLFFKFQQSYNIGASCSRAQCVALLLKRMNDTQQLPHGRVAFFNRPCADMCGLSSHICDVTGL